VKGSFSMEVNNIRSILSNKFHEAQSIMDKKEKVLNVISKGIKATASTSWAKKYKKDIELMGMMITDYVKNDYEYLNKSTIVIAISALLYIISPINKITDKIPFLKDIDNIAVITFALHAIREELKTYKLWLNTKNLRK
jgi:uncharacterized membrane protein YkvA (DUF1232 family)